MNGRGAQETRKQRIVHRLVGAAVLVALAVILVPLLLEVRGEGGGVITRSNIPERPEGFRVEEIILSPDIRGPSVAADTDPSAVDPEAAGTAGPTAAAEQHLQGWAVQIGSFSSEGNAITLRDQLRDNGFSAFLDVVTVGDGRMVRVLVGPDARRESSERLRDRLAGELKLDGVVVGYQ